MTVIPEIRKKNGIDPKPYRRIIMFSRLKTIEKVVDHYIKPHILEKTVYIYVKYT